MLLTNTVFWSRPLERFEEFVRHQAWREAVLVRVAGNAAEAFSERLGVAVFAAGADFEAPTHGVPSRLGPLDFGMLTQNARALEGFLDASHSGQGDDSRIVCMLRGIEKLST